MSEMTIIPDLYLEGDSKRWKNGQAIYLDIKTCKNCRKKHGKIYNFNEKEYQPEHERCRCSIVPMRTKEVGTATERVFDGADAWLLYRNRLPDYYSGTPDGLWDCLTDMLGGINHIEIHGLDMIEKKFPEEIEEIYSIFQKTKHAYNNKYAERFFVTIVHQNGTREELK